MKKNLIFFMIIIFNMSFYLSGNELDNSVEKEKKLKEYSDEKLSYTIKEEFDQRYPLNIKKFSFFQGVKKIEYNDFLKLTNDDFLLKQNEKIKRIKVGGFTTAAVFGGLTVGFFVPSAVFIAMQTNYNPVDTSYTFSGVAMVILTGVSFAGLIIDLLVTFVLLYNNKYSEYPLRKAVENYNENLRKKIGIVPELSFEKDKVNLELRAKF